MRIEPNDRPIVMVDDNVSEIVLARECYLSSNLQNPWRAFTSGIEFLGFLNDVKDEREPMPVVVFLDINMPQKTGFDVLRETRTDPFFTSLPVFMMLTNSDNVADKRRAEELRASGYFVKPDNVDDYVDLFNSLA